MEVCIDMHADSVDRAALGAVVMARRESWMLALRPTSEGTLASPTGKWARQYPLGSNKLGKIFFEHRYDMLKDGVALKPDWHTLLAGPDVVKLPFNDDLGMVGELEESRPEQGADDVAITDTDLTPAERWNALHPRERDALLFEAEVDKATTQKQGPVGQAYKKREAKLLNRVAARAAMRKAVAKSFKRGRTAAAEEKSVTESIGSFERSIEPTGIRTGHCRARKRRRR